ncbi:hypothetical protein [Massilia rubra]|uniref:Uncharacterized protein n=1 Tax=Massilia rubra TaxID=2607910 RepID=A0ABX0M4C1_9BURK|nr:hypothetical protein [Massilia rubra]NHZ38464.1 hypothetical protein [Massilia rubra]
MATASTRSSNRKRANESASQITIPVASSSVASGSLSTGPTTSNTVAFPYFHNANLGTNCKADAQRVEDNCTRNGRPQKKSPKKTKFAALNKLNAEAKKDSKFKVNDKNQWIADHCSGLWRKPGSKRGKKGAEKFNTAEFKATVSKDISGLVTDLLTYGNEKTRAIASEKLLLEKPGPMEDAMATLMAAVAESNPCIKARKCRLVPYEKVSDTENGKGCCPGQTGHHVIPNAMFDTFAPVTETVGEGNKKKTVTAMKSQGLRKCWDTYKENEALTICLEGTANRDANGSHGFAHAGTEEIIKIFRNSPNMRYIDARNLITNMLARMFGCNKDCLADQLDDRLAGYYKKGPDCGVFPDDAMVTPHSGRGGGGPNLPADSDPLDTSISI